MANDTGRRTLYRDKKNGKIAGVCAGIANYFNIETWLIRIIAVTAVVFGQGFVVVIYIAAWMILDEKPVSATNGDHDPIELKTKVWQAGEPPRRALREVSTDFSELEQRLQQMERYVTSNAYKIDRELNQL